MYCLFSPSCHVQRNEMWFPQRLSPPVDLCTPLFGSWGGGVSEYEVKWVLFTWGPVKHFSTQHQASLAVVCWEWTILIPEACRLHPLSVTHRNFCSCSRKISWIFNWKVHYSKCAFTTSLLWPYSDLRLSYSQIHQALGLLHMYLCSYFWIYHFQQMAEFLFCADRFVLDFCNKHVPESHPVGGRSLEWCY